MIQLLKDQIEQLRHALNGLGAHLDEFTSLEAVAGAETSAALGKMLHGVQKLKVKTAKGQYNPAATK